MPRPVPLAAIKADPALTGLPLIRQSRLSVMPVSEAHWAHICRLGGWKE
jgi:predicted RNA-binding protein with PUA-like domain